jgi:hypothetical protein
MIVVSRGFPGCVGRKPAETGQTATGGLAPPPGSSTHPQAGGSEATPACACAPRLADSGGRGCRATRKCRAKREHAVGGRTTADVRRIAEREARSDLFRMSGCRIACLIRYNLPQHRMRSISVTCDGKSSLSWCPIQATSMGRDTSEPSGPLGCRSRNFPVAGVITN